MTVMKWFTTVFHDGYGTFLATEFVFSYLRLNLKWADRWPFFALDNNYYFYLGFNRFNPRWKLYLVLNTR
jgi:hypothetical protein